MNVLAIFIRLKAHSNADNCRCGAAAFALAKEQQSATLGTKELIGS